MYLQNFKIFRINLSFLLGWLMCCQILYGKAKNELVAYTINGNKVTFEEMKTQNQGAFYDLEKSMYNKIAGLAQEDYLKSYWKKLALKTNKKVTADDIIAARENYLSTKIKVTDKEIEETLGLYKEQLKDIPVEKQRAQVEAFLKAAAQRTIIESILRDAINKGKLVVDYPNPVEPRFELEYNPSTDYVRYGPELTHTTALGCEVGKCAITVYEYSEFQCPFCNRVQGTIKQLLTEYQGKIAWIFRDFPLSFHDRAKPAAIAAKCAGKQGKFWQMYAKIFENQSKLSDDDLIKHANSIKLDNKKFDECLKNPAELEAIVDVNFRSGAKLGVNGTPAFFINGRRISGGQPYSEFKRIFEEEMALLTKSKNNNSTKSSG